LIAAIMMSTFMPSVCVTSTRPTDWAIPTLGTVITLLPKGFTSLYQPGNASQVLVVMEGELEIRLTGGIHFRLKPKDIFALPSWLSYRHRHDRPRFGISLFPEVGRWVFGVGPVDCHP
jgi:gentisate 1,2-dioxygenase